MRHFTKWLEVLTLDGKRNHKKCFTQEELLGFYLKERVKDFWEMEILNLEWWGSVIHTLLWNQEKWSAPIAMWKQSFILPHCPISCLPQYVLPQFSHCGGDKESKISFSFCLEVGKNYRKIIRHNILNKFKFLFQLLFIDWFLVRSGNGNIPTIQIFKNAKSPLCPHPSPGIMLLTVWLYLPGFKFDAIYNHNISKPKSIVFFSALSPPTHCIMKILRTIFK